MAKAEFTGQGKRDDPWIPKIPVGGWYGLKKGPRGRFANYVRPVM